MFIINVILIIWQLPQVILSVFVLLFYSKSKRKYKTVRLTNKLASTVYVVKASVFSGTSLGPIIIITDKIMALDPNDRDRIILHESGHSKQSLMFGPLYLLIVGLPSITRNLMSRTNKNVSANYYKTFPESHADKLGGVER